MSRTAKVFVSCAAGAGIGTLVALELNTYLWWIGLLVGALVGYLSYEFKQVIKAVPIVGNRVIHWWPTEIFVTNLYLFLFFISWMGAFFVFFSVLFPLLPLLDASAFSVLGGCLAGFFILDCFLDSALISGNQPTVRSVFWTANPLTTPLFLVYMFFKYTSRFLWYLFRLIHSEIRLLCAVDSAIGAVIGYASGSVIIGALAGGLIGLLNYEIVSKRWLKLSPANENAS